MKRKKDEIDEKLVAAYLDKCTVTHDCCREIAIYNSNSNFSGDDNFGNKLPDIKKINLKLNPKQIFIISALLLVIAVYNYFAHYPFVPFLAVSVIFGCYGFHLLVKKDIDEQMKALDGVRQDMQDLINPNRMYERLGVDILELNVGQGLLEIADPDKDGTLLSKIAALRQRLTDTLGYIIPNVRIRDSEELDEKEYSIYVRGNLVSTGISYPKKIMVDAFLFDEEEYSVPKNAIIANSPIDGRKVYWLNKTDIKNKKMPYMCCEDVIIEHLRDCCIKHVNKILEKRDVLKLMELVKSQDPTLVNDLVPLFISAIDLKTIFCNLISKGISIKDIIYIFEILNDHARYTGDVNRLTGILIEELAGFKL